MSNRWWPTWFDREIALDRPSRSLPSEDEPFTPEWYEKQRLHTMAELKAKYAVYWNRRRVRIQNAPGDPFTSAQFMSLITKYAGRCFYCGEHPRGPLHAEHRNPLSRGGANDIANIVPACSRCNGRKGTKTEAEFLMVLHP